MLNKRLFEELAEQKKVLVRQKEAIEDVAEQRATGSVNIAYVRGMLESSRGCRTRWVMSGRSSWRIC